MKSRLSFASSLLALALPLDASLRSSASYAIPAETFDGGGLRATSTNYAADGSIGGIGGISNITAPAGTMKSGYIGQVYEVTGLTLNAVSLDVNEGATDQLAAWQTLDDSTFLAVPAANVAWSVASGPLAGISASGLASAGLVFQDTSASAQGVYLGNTGILALTVKNTNLDDFGSYTGDGLDDAWQNEYFGLDNPLAAPAADPDGDGQTNAFEFTAGVIPNDPASRFILSVSPVPGEPAWKDVIFSPRLADRSYSVSFKSDLNTATWTLLPGGIISDAGSQRIVTDPAATDTTRFYRVEITK